MKCINCGTDNTLRDRTEHQGKCKNCGTPFAFEPTAMAAKEKLTDGAFLRILNDLSANGALYFTKAQLFYAIVKRTRPQVSGDFAFGFLFLLGFLSILVGGVAGFLSSGFSSFLLIYTTVWLLGLWFQSQNLTLFRRERLQAARELGILGGLSLGLGFLCRYVLRQSGFALVLVLLGLNSIVLGFWQRRRIPKMPEASLATTPEFFQQLLSKWAQAHGVPDKLLLPALASDVFPVPDDDVTNYSFDRLIVCQSDDIAKMLIANNVPFEYSSGVVSLGGYPHDLFSSILAMAKRNPRLGVYVLHDASAAGLRCRYTVTHDPQWFGGQDYLVVDVGLSPRQILGAKKPVFTLHSTEAMRAAFQLPAEVRLSLPPAELQWLDEGHYVLLEFFPPQKIIQALSRSLALGAQVDTLAESDGSLLVLGDSDFYGVESFG